MRNASLIATAVAAVCGCKSTPVTPAVSVADQMGTWTCKNVQSDGTGSDSCVDTTDHFDATIPVVYVTYRTPDLPKAGDSYVIQWIATDVGSAAPANTVIATLDKPVGDVPAATRSYTVNGSLSKPTNGWPVGKYRVEIKLGDKLVTSAKFAIQ